MRKRRRLVDKITISVCAVLVAVSAFFYAPMDVSAEEIIRSSSADVSPVSLNGSVRRVDLGKFLYNESALGSDFYRIIFDYSVEINTDKPVRILQMNGLLGDSGIFFHPSPSYSGSVTHNTFSGSKVIVLNGNYLKGSSSLFLNYYFYSSSLGSINFEDNLTLNISSITKLTGEESATYQQGYNAGYSAGESAGYGNGYSNGFADGEASVDTDAIYDEAFQAGKDSVDTESYYDAGYQAGYQAAYSEGYDSGYDVGYQSAMDRFDGWGADTGNYPIEVSSGAYKDRYFSLLVKGWEPFQYEVFNSWTSSYDFNPNHTYMFDIDLGSFSYDSSDVLFIDESPFYLDVGGCSYLLSHYSNAENNKIFISGDRISSAWSFVWRPIASNYGSESGGNDGPSNSCSLTAFYGYKIYDMGPSGDTQNHIANQTDKLTNGFNDSEGNSVNSDFSAGLNDFETAEDSLFATATTGMKDFTFFDISSVPAMVTGMSFVGSIMSGWFTQAGGASGVGIVLSILFSIMLVAMVLGLYRWYQSKGGKD